MRSYYSHLQATRSQGEEVSLLQKPVFRSSAIFPVMQNEACRTHVLFMGYWLLKRHISEIGLLCTLRSADGRMLERKFISVNSARAFRISLSEFQHTATANFEGSIELEIHSTRDLVFPYPAFVLMYEGDHYATCVHTTGRVYNDIEDVSGNEEYTVPESGFDIYGDGERDSFFAFTNGPLANTNGQMHYTIDGPDGLRHSGVMDVGEVKAFETRFVYLKDHIGLDSILNKGAGSIKLTHSLRGFFPRFVAGNRHRHTGEMSITHTYYDSSQLADGKAFWTRGSDELYDSSVSIPLFTGEGYYTCVAVYPVFSPSKFMLGLHFYNEQGSLITHIENVHEVTPENLQYTQIDIGALIAARGIEGAVSVKLVCTWADKERIPTRVKFGLNVGRRQQENIGSNICFAPMLGNPKVLEKKGTFRWAPLLNHGSSSVVLTNGSSQKQYDRPARVRLSIHREEDDQQLLREATIGAECLHTISPATDPELAAFLQGKSGWIAAQSDNPFLNGYYFDFSESGAVAADHVF